MSEPISTTRISDLPENITIQPPVQYSNMAVQSAPGSQQIGQDALGNTYVPLNIHPNPYGVQQQQPTMPLPQQTTQQRGSDQQQYNPMAELQNMPQQRLPSRDIPMNPLQFQQDEEIQPNYVPRVKLTSDYIREYEAASEEALRTHEKEKHLESKTRNLFSDIQIPILISVFYFIFQMPIVTTLLYKYFSFLTIHNADGNMNFTGLLLKSVLFGSLFYLMQFTANTINNI
jgi:hypothetical protein